MNDKNIIDDGTNLKAAKAAEESIINESNIIFISTNVNCDLISIDTAKYNKNGTVEVHSAHCTATE
jgi:hypothetical protein